MTARCRECERPLRIPSPDGYGPVCRRQLGLTPRRRTASAGQLPLDIPKDPPMPDTTGEKYPAAIGIYCDTCGTTFEGDFIVTDDMDRAARFEAARAHLRTKDWTCHASGDFCPACLPSALRSLTEVFGESGCGDRSQRYAAELLAEHTRELAVLLHDEDAKTNLLAHAAELDALAAPEPPKDD